MKKRTTRYRVKVRYRPRDASLVKPVPLDTQRAEIRHIVKMSKKGYVTRNSPCPCGSGKRFKRCCMLKVQ